MTLNFLRVRKGQRAIVYLTLLFMLVFYGGFRLWPTLYSIILSLLNWRIGAPLLQTEFIGLNNYRFALFRDFLTLSSFKRTLVFATELVAMSGGLGLVAAVLIQSHRRHQPLLRVLYFLPYVVPEIVAGLLIRVLFQPQFGAVNATLNLLGIPDQPWMTSPQTALFTVALAGAWIRLGYNAMLFMTGLDQIPQDLLEAALVDGANEWQGFWRIKFPLLMPVVLFLIVTGSISALQTFGLIYAMSVGTIDIVGGPLYSTTIISVLIFNTGFGKGYTNDFDYAATLAVLLFVVILVLTLIQFRVMRSEWEY